MSKKTISRAPQSANTINWYVVGGIIAVGVLALIALIVWSNSGSSSVYQEAGKSKLDKYCTNNPANCIFVGNADAQVIVYELFDYGCPACKSFANTSEAQVIAKHVDTGEVRFGFLPVSLWPDKTHDAAEGAYCANEQNLFLPWHEQMYATMPESDDGVVDENRMMSVAQSVGIDTQLFSDCIKSNRYGAMPEANMNTSGITSTPSFFFNGFMVRGAISAQEFSNSVSTAKAVLRGK